MSDSKDSFTRKVPVDEMVERLKHHRSTGGDSQPVGFEVVGEGEEQQVVEIRRRRVRRSNQPKRSQEKRKKLFRFFTSVGIIPIGILFAAIYFATISHYQSRQFRDDVATRVSDVLGSEIEMRSLNIKGLAVTCPHLTVTPPRGDLLKSVDLRQIKADIDKATFFSKDWLIPGLAAESAQFQLQRPKTLRKVSSRPSSPLHHLASAGLGLDSSPEAFRVGTFHIENASVFWPPEDEGEEDAVEIIKNVAASTGALTRNSDFSLTGGRITVPTWPELELKEADLQIRDSKLEITNSKLHRQFSGDENGRASIVGTLDLTGPHALDLRVKMEGMEIRNMLISSWKDRIRGLIDVDAKINASLARPLSGLAEGSLTLKEGVLEKIPNLGDLSSHVGEIKIGRLAFESLRADFRRSASSLELSNIDGVVPGLFHLRGNMRITSEEKISGTLEVGISSRVLTERKFGKPEFFGEPDADDICWTPVKLGGKLIDIEDDLNTRFAEEANRIEESKQKLYPSLAPRPNDQQVLPGTKSAAEAAQTVEDQFRQLIDAAKEDR